MTEPTFPIEANRPVDYTCRFDWRHQFDDVRDAEERAATDIGYMGESLTNQSFTDDANINIMVKRFGITDGAIPPMALDPSYFGDFTEAPTSLREAHERMHIAQERFNQLPADIRSKFGNDYRTLAEWVMNPNNATEAVELGLLKQEKTPEVKTEPVSPGT